MPDITHSTTIQASPARVYEALTTASGVRSWWTKDTTLEPAVGSVGEFRFKNGAHVHRLRVEELVPNTRVGWKTVSSPHPEWLGTTFTWDITPAGSGTELTFAQRGYDEAGECYGHCDTAWAHFLQSIKLYLETGTGTPYADDPPPLRHVFQQYIRSDADTLWDAITNPELSEQWFFGGRLESDWQPGSPLVLRNAATGRVMLDNTVIAVDKPGRRIVHTFKSGGSPNEPSQASWHIRPIGDVCLLEVTHDFPDERHPDAQGTHANWQIVLPSLKTFVETGTSANAQLAAR